MIITPDMQTLVDFMKVHAMRGWKASLTYKPFALTGVNFTVRRQISMLRSGFCLFDPHSWSAVWALRLFRFYIDTLLQFKAR